MRVIPFTDYPRYSQEITLDDIPYRFDFDWNFRGQYWTMSVYDRELEPLILGLKVVVGRDLFGDFPGRDLPPGSMLAIADDGSLDRIEDGDLGERVNLVYFTEDEVEELESV